MNIKEVVFLNKFIFNKSFDIFISNKKELIYIKGMYGINILFLPSKIFVKLWKNKMTILFLSNFFFKSFKSSLFVIYKKMLYLYSVKLKIRGLGFRIRKIAENLYYFFFNYTNMFYFYIPNNILLKWFKKKLLLISNNFFLIKMIFSQILILKKIGPYRLRGLRYPRQIIFIKKGGKKF